MTGQASNRETPERFSQDTVSGLLRGLRNRLLRAMR